MSCQYLGWFSANGKGSQAQPGRTLPGSGRAAWGTMDLRRPAPAQHGPMRFRSNKNSVWVRVTEPATATVLGVSDRTMPLLLRATAYRDPRSWANCSSQPAGQWTFSATKEGLRKKIAPKALH